MASSDMTALMLQMMKQIQEQQLVAQEMMQEQQRAADERQRQSMAAILERRAGQTPTTTRSTIEKSPPIKIDFKEFAGNPRTGQRGPRSTGLSYRRLDVPMRLRKPRATKLR